MKKALWTLLVLVSPALFATNADYPAPLGDFQGVLFTGAGITREFSFQAGTFAECTVGKRRVSKHYKCQASGGEVVLGTTGHGEDRITLDRVVVLESSTLHYYYGGFRTIRIGDRDVVQRVRLTVNPTPKQADRISGYLELSELELRSGFEAYRKLVP